VFMTVHMLQQWGLPGSYHIEGDCRKLQDRRGWLGPARFGHGAGRVCFHIPGASAAEPTPARESYAIEADASAASYPLAAAAITGGRVTVLDIPPHSLQGDVAFVDCLEAMGCAVRRESDAITVIGRPLQGIDADMNGISDTVQTLSVVALFADGSTTIRHVAHVRHKETDRLAALATELRKLGATVTERDDGLEITPGPLRAATIDTYRDHRMAMSFALAGLRVHGVRINDPACVAKTYPAYFDDLRKAAKGSQSR